MRLRLLVLALLPAISFVACDSADNPTAPPNSVLSISASNTKIGLNGTSQITVSGFRPDGNPLPQGTVVRFSADMGVVEPVVTSIGVDGFARTIFRADGRAGTAKVTANLSTSGGGGESGGSGGSAEVTIEVSEEKPTLLINANPSTLRIQETSEVTVTARDENSLPLGAGEEILLTADLGILTQNGQQVGSVLTEGDGRARVIFEAGTQAGTGSVSAILRNSDEASVAITIRDAPADFLFQPSTFRVNASGGSIDLNVTVFNADGFVISGVPVRFDSEIAGTFSPDSTVSTNSNGSASATVTYEAENLPASGMTFEVSATVSIGGESRKEIRIITVN